MKFFNFKFFSKKSKQKINENIKEESVDLVDECCNNEAKIEHNVAFMRNSCQSEELIEDTVKEMRKRFAEKYNLTNEELVEILLQVYENELIEEKKRQNDYIYALLAQEDIEKAKQSGITGGELEALKFSKELEITILHSSELDTVDLFYGNIDREIKDKIIKYNNQVIFETCLRREIKLKSASYSWDDKQKEHYFQVRLFSYLNGKFNYPKEIRDAIEQIITQEDLQKPEEFRRLKNPDDFIKYQDRVEKKRATLPTVESEVLHKIYR